MSLGHPPHLIDFDYIGMYSYSLRWSCHRHQTLFTQQDRVNLVREQILRACRQTDFEVTVDCYMPDHVHKIVRGRTHNADALKLIKLAKQYSGYYFKRSFGVRLWQRYGYERFLRQDTDIWGAMQYVINNPIRACLVEKLEDYPFIGSQVYKREELIEIGMTGKSRSG
jgi:REP element-mobilizing transposase RayT